MDKPRPSFSSTVLRFISLILQISIMIILALLLVEIKQLRNADSDPVMVAIQRLPGTPPIDVTIRNSIGSPIPIEFPPTATPTVAVTNSASSPLHVL